MKRFKAGALYYAIFISFFIALISGFMILQYWYQHYYVLYVQQGQRLERNINSAVNVAIQKPELFPDGERKMLDLFDDSLDIVEITKSCWGGFELLHAVACWRVVRRSCIKMVGSEVLPQDAIALYLADKGKYLSIAGKTKIKGNCYLPKLGIRKAYIEGAGFSGNKLIEGNINESRKSLPNPDVTFIAKNRKSDQENISEQDSIIDIAYLLKTGSLKNSFYNKTIKINISTWLTIENLKLKGNIKILSKSGITVKKTAFLEDIILYAPKIEVEEGFSGSIQCFVTDTLVIGNNCIFKAPTLLALTETSIEKPLVEIGKNSLILGDIVIVAKSDKQNVIPECTINTDAIVNGSLYCAGKVNLQGTIKGQLFCKSFTFKTQSSIYENHLLNATLNSYLLSPYYASSFYCSSEKPQKVIQCLE